MNVTSKKNGVYKRNFSCLCKFCYSNDYKSCIYLDDAKFVDNKDQVRPIWGTFEDKGEGSRKLKENRINVAAVVKILPVKVKKRLITRKQKYHVLLNVMMLPWYVQGMDFHIT